MTASRVVQTTTARPFVHDLFFLTAFILLAALYQTQRAFGWFPAPLVIGSIGIVALAIVALRFGTWPQPRSGTVLALMAASAAIAVLAAWFSPGGLTLYGAGMNLAGVSLGWAFVFTLPLGEGQLASYGKGDSKPHRVLLIIGLLIVAVSLALFHWLARGQGARIIDEVMYLLQGRLMRRGQYSQPLDPVLAPFFALKYAVAEGGRLYTQYPPGWPLLLAAFDTIGLRWWASTVLGTASVLLTYWIGQHVHSKRAGFIAAALLASSRYFVATASTYYAHTATATVLCAAAAALLRSEKATARGRIAWWLLGGILIGFAGAIRPLTGVAVGASLVIWLILRARLGARGSIAMLACLMVGASAPAAFTLDYNARTTGHPLEFGIQKTHGPYGRLGFGVRGDIVYDQNGVAHAPRDSFTLRKAVRHFMGRVWDFCSDVPAVAMLLPILGLAVATSYPLSIGVIGAFMLLPVVHFFYWWTSIRYYQELMPFAWIGVASILAHVWQGHRTAARRLLMFVILVQLASVPLMQRVQWSSRASATPYINAVQAAQRKHGKVLVFVREDEARAHILWNLYSFNAEDWFGNVIVARDLGARDSLLTKRFPDHVPFRTEWRRDPIGHQPLLEPFASVEHGQQQLRPQQAARL